MIEVRGLTKRYGDKTAVEGLTFTVSPGVVTGFLGPNGAGKSTTMRMIVGLDRPTSGTVTVNGSAYRDHAAPLAQVGSLLEAKAVHTGRTAYDHLLAMAATCGLPRRRVDEVIDLVGLHEVARKRAGGFSLGMGQRLGIASALLGDPQTLLLDEPVNGLDPDGVLWIRNLLKRLAAEGRTVFVSSHLMSEMALTAERLVVIGRGRLIADCTTAEFIERAASSSVRVRCREPERLRALLAADGAAVAVQEGAVPGGARPDGAVPEGVVPGGALPDGAVLEVTGRTTDQIGELAGAHGVVLHELAPQQASLEQAFMKVTAGAVEYHAVGQGQPT